MIRLLHPWALFLLALVPLAWWAYENRRLRGSVRFPGVRRFAGQPRPWSLRARKALPIARCLAIALIVLSIARPQKADEQTRVLTEGIAIQLVLDRSGSMGQEDFLAPGSPPQTRLDAVKQIVHEFIEGNDESLRGRRDDLIGLIAFARYPDTLCPLTHDHQHLDGAIESIELPRTREEDGTAIGDALLLGVERIRNITRRFKEKDDFKIKSRVIVLLTDGEQNAGKHSPREAAEAAAALGVKVYAIGAAPEFQEQRVGGFFMQPRTVRVPIQINEKDLNEVAEITGGKYFRARDVNSLRDIYAEIDKLERSAVDEERYFLVDELSYEWAKLGAVRLPPPLLVALILLAVEVVLAHTRFRRIP